MSASTTPRPAGASRLPIPEGTLPVGVGLLVSGISSYLFFKIGKQHLGDAGFDPVASLWFAIFGLAPGFFLPVEQEMGRALAQRRALGHGGRPVVRRLALLAAGLAVIVSIVLVVLGPLTAEHLFHDNWVMAMLLVVGFVAYAPVHLTRGVCSGSARFKGYAIILGFDGAARIIGCGLLAAFGVKGAGWFGAVVALAPLTGLAVVLSQGSHRTEPGPEATWSEVTPNLGWLLTGSVCAAALLNAGPIATKILASGDEKGLVTAFGTGVLLTRIPLFLFQAVQASLLPRLARLAAEGNQAEFRSGFRRLLTLVCAVGLLGTVGCLVFGPPVLRGVFEVDLSRRTMTALALGSAFYMVALTAAQAVIALHGHAWVALGWTVAVVGFLGGVAFLGDGTFQRVELGLLVGSGAGMVTFLFALAARLRAHATPDAGSMIEAVTDLPLEG